MPCFFCPYKFFRVYPIESFFKLFFLSVHTIVELYTGFHRSSVDNHIIIEYENLHHVCMLSGFIVGSIVEILIFYGVRFPEKTDYMFNLLAFFIQAVLMSNHLHGDQGLEYQVHVSWTFIIICTFVAACLEAFRPNDFWPVYLRTYFFLCQGTWLMQIAFVVWPHTSNPIFIWGTDHASHTWLNVSLMYHFIGCAIILLLQYTFINCTINTFDRCYQRYEQDLDDKKGYYNKANYTSSEYFKLMNDPDDNEV